MHHKFSTLALRDYFSLPHTRLDLTAALLERLDVANIGLYRSRGCDSLGLGRHDLLRCGGRYEHLRGNLDGLRSRHVASDSQDHPGTRELLLVHRRLTRKDKNPRGDEGESSEGEGGDRLGVHHEDHFTLLRREANRISLQPSNMSLFQNFKSA